MTNDSKSSAKRKGERDATLSVEHRMAIVRTGKTGSGRYLTLPCFSGNQEESQQYCLWGPVSCVVRRRF